MFASAIASLFVLAQPAPAEEQGDRPNVEILASRGAIDGAEAGANVAVQQLRLELRVINRLSAEVDQLSVSIELVSPGEAGEEPIAGWRFEHSFGESVIVPKDEVLLRIDRTLPARRRVHAPDEINYRVTVLGYRVVPPSLDLAMTLLESPSPGDQRAALRSYQRLAELGAGPGVAELVTHEIARAIANPPGEPTPSSALRLLFALRAAADLDHPPLVPLLLALPEKLEGARWGPALAELAARMQEASEPNEPRLEVLPAWARASPEVVNATGDDLLLASAREAILRLGDHAVPELVRAAQLGESETSRAMATSVLGALGRATARSQLSIDDRDARTRLIEVYGEIGSAEPVAALLELVATRSPASREVITAALRKIGPPAIPPLADALSTPDKASRKRVLDLIEAIGPEGRGELVSAARRYGVKVEAASDTRAIASQLADHLAAGARARWATELRRAVGLGRAGEHEEAFRVLDSVYAADPELYMEHSAEIARLYSSRARELYGRGNYDAVIETLRIGRTIEPLPEMSTLLRDTQLTLARGYLELGQLDRAEEALEQAEALGSHAELRLVRARVLSRKAEAALDRGEYGQARALIDRARGLAPEDEEMRHINRRLLLTENVPIVIVLSLVVPGGALSLIVFLRRRMQAARLAEMTRE